MHIKDKMRACMLSISVVLCAMLPVFSTSSVSHICQISSAGPESLGARYKTTVRRGKVVKVDVQTIEVSALPSDLLPPSCYDDIRLEQRAAAAAALPAVIAELHVVTTAWTSVQGVSISPGKGSSLVWQVDSLPCMTYSFRLVFIKNDEVVAATEAVSHGPAEAEHMELSKYEPEPPTNITITSMEERARFSWVPAICADAYEVNLKGIGKHYNVEKETLEHSIEMSGVPACSHMEFGIYSRVGGHLGNELKKYFITGPSTRDFHEEQIAIIANSSAAIIRWEVSSALSCLDKFKVDVCLETRCSERPGEHQTFEVSRGELGEAVVHAAGLHHTAIYRLQLELIHNNVSVGVVEKVFQTQFNPEEFHLQVTPQVKERALTAIWDDLPAALYYLLYQRSDEDDIWQLVANLTVTTYTLPVRPCTPNLFGVAVGLVGGAVTDLVGSEPVWVDLDTEAAFLPENLALQESDGGLNISWLQYACINHYRVLTCGYEDCQEDTIKSQEARWFWPLEPCKNHSVQIWPVVGAEAWKGLPWQHSISREVALLPPVISHITDNWTKSMSLELSWPAVACAHQYLLHLHQVNSGRPAIELVTELTQLTLSAPQLQPCVSYMATLSSQAGELRSSGSSVELTTGPSLTKLSSLNIQMDVGEQEVQLTLPTDEEVACVTTFSIEACTLTGHCIDPVYSVNGSSGLVGLEPATAYRLTVAADGIKNVYTEVELRTLSNLDTVRLTSRLIASDKALLRWDSVDTAEAYHIYQEDDENEMRPILQTTGTEAEVVQPHCSLSTYHLAVEEGGCIRRIPGPSTAVMSGPDPSADFQLDDLRTTEDQLIAHVDWNHQHCITSYVVKLCENETALCHPQEEVDQPHLQADLQPVKAKITRVAAIIRIPRCGVDYHITVAPADWTGKPAVIPFSSTECPPIIKMENKEPLSSLAASRSNLAKLSPQQIAVLVFIMLLSL